MAEKDPQEDFGFHNGQGETPDHQSLHILQLAHEAIKKFPNLAIRHRKFIGTTAVVSTSLVVLATVAINLRLRRGHSPAKILAEITQEEIEGAKYPDPKRPKRRKSVLP